MTLGRDENLRTRVSGRRCGRQEGTEATNRSILDSRAADVELPWLSSRCHTKLRPHGRTGVDTPVKALFGGAAPVAGSFAHLADSGCRLATFASDLILASVWSWRRKAEGGGAERNECSAPTRSGDAKLQTEAGANAVCPLPLATSVAFAKRNGRGQGDNGVGRQPVERSKGHARRGGVGVS